MPPGLLSTLTTHSSTYYRLLKTVLTIRSTISRFIDPLLTKLLHSPDVPSVLLLLLLLFVGFKILDLAYRSIMFWIRLSIRLVFYTSIVVVGIWIWQRGADGVMADLSYVGREWNREYDGWKKRSEMAKVQRQMGFGGRNR